jgi:pimeloyl-ACP methyl ester carboxylesterase
MFMGADTHSLRKLSGYQNAKISQARGRHDEFTDRQHLPARCRHACRCRSWRPAAANVRFHAIGAAPIGTLACADTWIEDFRKDIPHIDVPTMIIYGDDDRILPADATSRRQARVIRDVKYVEIKGGSHGITWTRVDEINAELVQFLGQSTEGDTCHA